LLKVSYKLACRRILEFLSRHYGIESSLWLQREAGEFETAAVYGEFEDKPVRFGITPDDKRIRAAVRDDSPIVLKERQTDADKKARLIQLFPVVIGGEVRNALGVAREQMDPELSARVLKFCRYVASRLEILRLREAVADRERLNRMLREFNDQLRKIDDDSFWQGLTSVSAELVQAERASLLVVGPSEKLTPKATIGIRMDLSIAEDIGDRVAKSILEKGKPVLVMDIARAQLPPTPAERRYRSTSFISYPITIGERAIGVINFTDKVGGDKFERRDLELLDSIAPQIAVAVDRMALRDKAGEYAQLSITDPLTGLLNRRYVEERLSEEINRSDRNGAPVTFMMLDVDEFKSYNDRYGHPAGDEALQMIGHILSENLRGADVAARYGGEEFSVLLPETSIDEAQSIAERIRRHVEETKFPKRKVTVSIGIATLGGNTNAVRELISAADIALYEAKRAGRNNIKVYNESTMDPSEQVH
jgi:diguanylate cyclase (GGDEF)-like protein